MDLFNLTIVRSNHPSFYLERLFSLVFLRNNIVIFFIFLHYMIWLYVFNLDLTINLSNYLANSLGWTNLCIQGSKLTQTGKICVQIEAHNVYFPMKQNPLKNSLWIKRYGRNSEQRSFFSIDFKRFEHFWVMITSKLLWTL